MIGGGGLFLMTAWLLLKGGPHVGQHLQLLSQYFIGYSVTWWGSIVGFAWGALWWNPRVGNRRDLQQNRGDTGKVMPHLGKSVCGKRAGGLHSKSLSQSRRTETLLQGDHHQDWECERTGVDGIR